MNNKKASKDMVKIFFSTSNQGKLNEAKRLAVKYDIEIISPIDLDINVDVVEDGVTFAENAIKKVEAYQKYIDDIEVMVIGDDSGVEISILDGKPGVFSRRWAGYEMTDIEMRDYCLEQMRDFEGDDRRAVMKTTIALGRSDRPMQIFDGELQGVILEKISDDDLVSGLAFSPIFFIPEINESLAGLQAKDMDARGGFMTHRERALTKLFEYINSIR